MMRRELLIEKFIPPTEIINNCEIWRNKYGELHSFNNQPSILYYDNNYRKKIIFEQWSKNGLFHRTGDKPACVQYINEKKHLEIWNKDGKRHRIGNKPAFISYYENGKICWECWYMNGKFIKEKTHKQPSVLKCYINNIYIFLKKTCNKAKKKLYLSNKF